MPYGSLDSILCLIQIFSADLTIMEEGTELLVRLKKALVDGDKKVSLPMFTSCSPGWIKFIEHKYPEFLPNLSTCKSPQQMFGALAKTFYANKRKYRSFKNSIGFNNAMYC